MKNMILSMLVVLTGVILVIHMTLIAGCESKDGDQVSDDSSGSTTDPPSSGDSSNNQSTTTGQSTTPSTTSGPSLPLDELLKGMTLVGDLVARTRAQQECMAQGRNMIWMQDDQGQWWVECCPVNQYPFSRLPDRPRCRPVVSG